MFSCIIPLVSGKGQEICSAEKIQLVGIANQLNFTKDGVQ